MKTAGKQKQMELNKPIQQAFNKNNSFLNILIINAAIYSWIYDQFAISVTILYKLQALPLILRLNTQLACLMEIKCCFFSNNFSFHANEIMKLPRLKLSKPDASKTKSKKGSRNEIKLNFLKLQFQKLI